LYPPNKVVLWDDATCKEVAELEFRERVRGLVCRRGWFAVALRRRVVVFEVGETVTRYGEWDTCDNPRGLLAMATGAYSTLLAIPGHQMGHVQLLHLPPCRPPEPIGPPSSTVPQPPPAPTKHPVSIIVAHESALNTIALPISGRLLATTSSIGTLVRIWDALTGKLFRELRRGTDKAEIYGVAFRPDEREICVWSDKGTVHVFALASGSGPSNRQSTFSPLTPFLPLPKYFDSEWSYAQYRIPSQLNHIALSSTSSRSQSSGITDEEKCVVGWITVPLEDGDTDSTDHQLVALTYTGGWYRLGLPNRTITATTPSAPRTNALPLTGSPPSVKSKSKKQHHPRSYSGSSFSRNDKGKEKEGSEREGKESRDCKLEEYRKFGRFDGW